MPTSTAGKSTSQKGFTLLELSIVILLFGLFALLALPRLEAFGPRGLDGSARRLGGTVKYLFNEAALTGREYRLTFDFEQRSYRAAVVETGGEVHELRELGKGAVLADGVKFRDLLVPGRGSFSAGKVTIGIHPTGWLEETVIHLEDRQGGLLTLRVSPLTGIAEPFDGYRDFR